MTAKTIHFLDAGVMPYGEALALQHALAAAKKRGDARDFLVFVEHPSVITLGRRSDQAHLKIHRAMLAARGVEVFDVERGGDVTYHGPGQLVGYPILDLKRAKLGVHEYLRLLEKALIAALSEFAVPAWRRERLTGVWNEAGKVAAIGIAVSRWVSYHGFALNVKSNLSGFDFIVPCGLAGEKVTSMEAILGRPVDMDAVKSAVLGAICAALGAEAVDAAGVPAPEEALR